MTEWHIPDLKTLENKFNTDISDGLSARAARERLEKQKKCWGGRDRSLFVAKKNATLKSLFAFAISPLTVLLLFISLLTAFFGRGFLGSLVFAITLVAVIYGGIVNLRAERRLDGMKEYASPMVRVKRGGNIFHTDGRNLVVGDVILLNNGDLLPCDARIIKCDSLFVDEIIPKSTGDGLIRRRVMKQSSIAYSADDNVFAPNAANMLYAGSAIVNGCALALVVATGPDAYLSNYVSDGTLAGKDTEPEAVRSLNPILGKISFISSCSLLVLSLIGFITFKGEEEFIAYFTMLLSAIFLINTVSLTFTAKEIFSSYISRLSRTKSAKRKRDNSAAIRDIKALDKLTDVTDIVLFGTAGFYEGGFRVGETFVSGKTYKTLDICDSESETLITYVYTFLKALKGTDVDNELFNAGITDALYSYIRSSGFDINGATLALKSLYYANDMKSGYGFAYAETESSIFRVLLTTDNNILSKCRYIRDGEDAREISANDTEHIKSFGVNSAHEKYTRIFCVSQRDENIVLEGVLSVYQGFDKELESVIKDLSAFGINATIILTEENDEIVKLAKSDKFKNIFKKEVAFASEFKQNGRDITDGIGKYSAYVGFDHSEYSKLVTSMRENGSRIVSYGISDEYNEIMAKTDVVATCDVLRYSSEKHRDSIYEHLPAEGKDTNLRASQQTRLLSRVVVKRAHNGGGGVYSLFKAIRMSRGAYLSFAHSVLLFALLSVNLITFCSMSVITGNMLLNPLQVASLSSVFAILSLTVFSDSEHKLDVLAKKREYTAYPKSLLKSQRYTLISRVGVAFLTALTVKILDLIGVFGTNASYTLPIYICLLITMCIEVALIDLKHTKKGEGRSYTWFKVIIAYAVLLSVCAITTIKPFANEYFENGFGSYEYLIIPGYMILYGIALLVSHIINKRGGNTEF